MRLRLSTAGVYAWPFVVVVIVVVGIFVVGIVVGIVVATKFGIDLSVF